jgi:hypothetical protein
MRNKRRIRFDEQLDLFSRFDLFDLQPLALPALDPRR